MKKLFTDVSTITFLNNLHIRDFNRNILWDFIQLGVVTVYSSPKTALAVNFWKILDI